MSYSYILVGNLYLVTYLAENEGLCVKGEIPDPATTSLYGRTLFVISLDSSCHPFR